MRCRFGLSPPASFGPKTAGGARDKLSEGADAAKRYLARLDWTQHEQATALGLAELVRRNQVTPDELLEAAIERVESRNSAVNAVTMKLYDHGKQAIAGGLPDGPLRGVPVLMKDLTSAVEGVKMTRGSKFFADTPPSQIESEHVKRLKAAGLVIFGRTNTCELGLSLTCEPQLHGPTRNPWNLDHISGGSSGGAAAALAARMLPIADASDGFGSIPRARRLLRPGRPQTDPRPQHVGAPRRRGPRRQPNTRSASACATRPHCSMRPAVPDRVTPTSPPRPPAPSSTKSASIPAGSESAGPAKPQMAPLSIPNASVCCNKPCSSASISVTRLRNTIPK